MSPNSTAECILWPNNPERCTTVLVIQKIFAGLSLIGCLFVLFVIIVLKKYKAFVQKLILALVVSATLHSISYLVGNVYTESGPACRFQGVIMQYSDWSTLLWVLVIALNLLLVVLGKNKEKYLYWFHGFVWLTALFWTIIPFFGDNYGPAGIWCWIKRDSTGFRFGAWYIPLFLIVFAMLIIYIYIIYNVIQATRQRSGGNSDEDLRRSRSYRHELKPLLGYPLIYIVFYTPALIYRIEDASNNDQPTRFSLAVLIAILVPSIGVANALFFAVFNATVKELTWTRIKQGVIRLFIKEPTQIIHENYSVYDPSVAEKSGNTLELSSGYVSSNVITSPTLETYSPYHVH